MELDDVEDRLCLLPLGVAKDESLIYSSTIENLKFIYSGKRLGITGPQHKYAKENNYSLFIYEEAKCVLHELLELVGISLKCFVVTSMELGVNIQMEQGWNVIFIYYIFINRIRLL